MSNSRWYSRNSSRFSLGSARVILSRAWRPAVSGPRRKRSASLAWWYVPPMLKIVGIDQHGAVHATRFNLACGVLELANLTALPQERARARLLDLASSLTCPTVMEDADACLGFADRDPAASPGRAGCVGYGTTGQFAQVLPKFVLSGQSRGRLPLR